MNKTLYKTNIKANWGIFAFIFGMLMIYVSTSIAMFNPENADAMKAMFDMMPEGMIKAFGFTGLGTELTGYLAGYLYGFILIVFPLIYTALIANKMIAGHVDNGSMAYLLATPNTRKRVAGTQAIFLASTSALLIVIITGIIILMSAAVFPGHLEIPSFLLLNLVTLLLLVAVGGIGFLASCIFSDKKYSLAVGAGIPVLFVLFKMLADISEKVEFFRYFSIYSLLDAHRILEDVPYALIVGGSLLALSIVLYIAGIVIFNRKSLAI